jgi:hypothetical protein
MLYALFLITMLFATGLDPEFEIIDELSDNPIITGNATTLPDTYDPRDTDSCLPSIMNQGSCGNCYAFAAAYLLSHRICKSTGNKFTASTAEITGCDTTNYRCSGGRVDLSLYYLSLSGVVSESCRAFNYLSINCYYSKCSDGTMGDSVHYCKPGTVQYVNTAYYDLTFATNLIKSQVIKFGAIATDIIGSGGTFAYYYTSNPDSVFTEDVDNKATLSVDHSLVIIGWGPDYWIVANSWGTYWGYNGFAKVKMGIRKIGSVIYLCEPI